MRIEADFAQQVTSRSTPDIAFHNTFDCILQCIRMVCVVQAVENQCGDRPNAKNADGIPFAIGEQRIRGGRENLGCTWRRRFGCEPNPALKLPRILALFCVDRNAAPSADIRVLYSGQLGKAGEWASLAGSSGQRQIAPGVLRF
jgi:hypothetical protein